MNKFKIFLMVGMIFFSPATFAATSTTVAVIPIANIVVTAPVSNSNISTISIPVVGIVFASLLFGFGILGRRKKKPKTTDVDEFASTN